MDTDDAKKVASGVLAGLLIALAAAGGIYALSATAASALAAGFVAPHASAHERIASIASATNRATVERKLARAKCKRFAGAKRSDCNAEAKAVEEQAIAEARAHL